MIDYGIADCEPDDHFADHSYCCGCDDRDSELACIRDDIKDVISVLYEGGDLRSYELDKAIVQLCHRAGLLAPKRTLEDVYGRIMTL